MAYQRTEYHREVQRDQEERDNKQGGWRSWFGLGDNKDREEDRGYSYSNTTTFRNPQPSSYGYSSAPHPERSGFSSGPRGGYGYSTSDEVNRGPSYVPSWNTDRDYNTRAGYGQTGDRDVYYKAEARTYGGDKYDNWTPSRPTTGDYSYRYEKEYPTTSRYPTGTSEYPTSRYYPTGEYPTSRYYPTGEYPTSRGYGYPTSTGYGYEQRAPSRGYPTTTGEFTGKYDYPTTSGRYGFSGESRTGGYGYEREYPTTGGRYGYTSGGYGGERDYKTGTYQPSSYRY